MAFGLGGKGEMQLVALALHPNQRKAGMASEKSERSVFAGHGQILKEIAGM